ncbi:MAG: exodeoxyribonuclease VII large subunit [Verrucomicrobia bacterium GWF2_51_19]|nr:MAG: exodeoxyribonuclease VII large subunit [Verrucomicrobia bacterium GWF2_51_19]HCJ12232.1 exodeoxyribonuclease VII large subunit [Opitutae bacterium]
MLSPSERALSDQVNQVLSVSDFTLNLKQVLEGHFAEVWIRGEVSNCRQQSSGHVYFTLKDENAQISAVLFKGHALRYANLVKEGQRIVVFGNVSVYAPKGNYQVLVRFVASDGMGKLQLEFNRLKEQLGREGLFDPERKKPLPLLPKKIALVTSPTGAAIHDFISILKRRKWAGTVIVFPSKVQGEGAKEELVTQIQRADGMAVDVIVVCRGGGSLEDLWPFNEAVVVRAIAACSTPVISAVGHEIDFTLADFAADFRAETPSAAAERITSDRIAVLERIDGTKHFLAKEAKHRLAVWKSHLLRLQAGLSPATLKRTFENAILHHDDLTRAFALALQRHLDQKRTHYTHVQHRFAQTHPEHALSQSRNRVQQVEHRLHNLSFAHTLQRGFALIRDPHGHPLARKALFGEKLIVEMADGTTAVRMDSGLND